MEPLEILEAMQGKSIAVVGDPIVDQYIFGRVERICPEAPVPVFIPEREESRPGGADNVAAQLDALGCHVGRLMPANVSRKTRFMAGHHLLLRVDEDATYRPDSHDITHVSQRIAMQRELDAVVLSDYARGWLSTDMCGEVIHTARVRGAPVIVDPKGTDWFKYVGCALICPSDSDFASSDVRSLQTFPSVLWKRGARGMQLTENGHTQNIPTTARRLYDVTGAGDTVVAVVAAAVAAGATYLEAAKLAAVAAGYVVGEVGTTACPLEKLKELVNAS